MNRRGFIKFIVGGAAGTLFTPIPWKLADDSSIWSQNWSWIPRLKTGAVTAVPAVSKLCPSGCAVKVKKVGGIAFGTQGNKDNDYSKGGLCPMCASGVQLMRSPSRVKGPMKKAGEGKYEPLSWDDAKKLLADKLKGLKGQDGKVAIISGDATGTANEVLSGFLAGLGSKAYYQMPCEAQAMNKAWQGLMGGKGQVGYDLDGADFVLMVGADALESFGPAVRNQAVFASKRPIGEDAKASYVYAGPVRTRTAAVCDKWVPMQPAGALALVLGLANAAIKSGKSVPASDFAEFQSLAAKYGPEAVEKASGVKADALADLAKRMLAAKNPVVLVGSAFGQGGGAALAAAGAGLNMLIGGLAAIGEFPKAVASAFDSKDMFAKDTAGWLANVAADKAPAPEVLFVYEANPAYALPQAATMAKALDKAGLLVSFSTFMDETAAIADLILPAPHSFERYEDAQTPFGLGKATYLLAAPAAEAEKDVKSTPDFILELAQALGIDLGFASFEEVLKAKVQAMNGDWDALTGGAAAIFELRGGMADSLAAQALAKAAEAMKPAELVVAPVAERNVGYAGIATPPHNLPTVSDNQLYGASLLVKVCSETAKKLGVTEGAKVKIAGQGGECLAKIAISEGVMPGVVAAPLGLGRTAWDAFTKGKGDNVYKILTVSAEPGTGLSVWSGSAVSVSKM